MVNSLNKKQVLLIVGLLVGFLYLIYSKTSGPQTLEVQESPLSSSERFVNLTAQDQYKYIERLTDQKGPEATWQFINETFKDPAKIQSAHDLAHLIGGLIYQKKGFSGLSICTPSFAFGCYHGFLDEAFAKDTTNLSLAEDACNKLGPVNSGPVASCLHGIGHGLASFYQLRNLEGSLKECDRLKNGQMFCYDGVFMEYERSAAPNFYNITDLLYPCDKLPDVYSASCGRNQPQVMMQRFRMDFNKVIETCGQSDNLQLQEACFDSLGFYTVSSTGGNTTEIIALCKQPQIDNFTKRCLKAAAGELVFQNFPNWQERSQQVCFSQEDQANKEDCYNYIQQLARDYQRN